MRSRARNANARLWRPARKCSSDWRRKGNSTVEYSKQSLNIAGGWHGQVSSPWNTCPSQVVLPAGSGEASRLDGAGAAVPGGTLASALALDFVDRVPAATGIGPPISESGPLKEAGRKFRRLCPLHPEK